MVVTILLNPMIDDVKESRLKELKLAINDARHPNCEESKPANKGIPKPH